MLIKPSTTLRNEYNEISQMCRENGQPVYITKNGEGDLVVMSIESYERREAMLDLRAKVLEAYTELASGAQRIPLDMAEQQILEMLHEKA